MVVAACGLIIGYLGIFIMVSMVGWTHHLPDWCETIALWIFLSLITGGSVLGAWGILNYCIYFTQYLIKIDF